MVWPDVSTDIIHGDIKPQNVLIFKEQDGTYTARVIDFGYSTRHADDTNPIMMAISKPWNAPEHNRLDKEWTSSEARKLDYFSFGMLCLWILFEKDLSVPTPSFREAASRGGYKIPCSQPEQSLEILDDCKVDQKLPMLVQWLLEVEEKLTNDERGALKEFLTSLLDEDKDIRDMSAGNVLRMYVLNFQSKIES